MLFKHACYGNIIITLNREIMHFNPWTIQEKEINTQIFEERIFKQSSSRRGMFSFHGAMLLCTNDSRGNNRGREQAKEIGHIESSWRREKWIKIISPAKQWNKQKYWKLDKNKRKVGFTKTQKKNRRNLYLRQAYLHSLYYFQYVLLSSAWKE